MTKNLSKKNFNQLSKTLDKIFINILDDISIRFNINNEDLEKYYPEKFKKSQKNLNKKSNIELNKE